MPEQPKLLLLHFTRNLRLTANPLLHAVQYGIPAAAVYFLPAHSNPRQMYFLSQTLAELSDGLAEYGIPLHVFEGSPTEHLNALMARYPTARLITAQHIRLPDDPSCRVQYAQEEILSLPVRRTTLDTSLPPDLAVYRDAWLRKVAKSAAETDSTPDKAAVRRVQQHLPPELRDAPPPPSVPAQTLPQTGGETAAWTAWRAFTPKLPYYGLMRDFPAQKGTSQLSAALRFGLLPVRRLVRTAQVMGGESAEKWLHSVFYGDYCRRRVPFAAGLWAWEDGALVEIRPPAAAPAMPPLSEEQAAAFDLWRRGRTGVPLIDAAMRLLDGGGWMHPRLRPLCAAFAVSTLGIPQAAGEACFAAALTDYDYSANRVGWQTAAAARMKNPFAESQNLDPGGRFIRSHLPEIAHLPDNLIHAPHRAGSGVSLNGYPAPIV